MYCLKSGRKFDSNFSVARHFRLQIIYLKNNVLDESLCINSKLGTRFKSQCKIDIRPQSFHLIILTSDKIIVK